VADSQGRLLGCIVFMRLWGRRWAAASSRPMDGLSSPDVRGGLGSDLGVCFCSGLAARSKSITEARESVFGEAWSRRVGTAVGSEAFIGLTWAEFVADVPLGGGESDGPYHRDLEGSVEELVNRVAPALGLGSSGSGRVSARCRVGSRDVGESRR
jgi:hypothetical protein